MSHQPFLDSQLDAQKHFQKKWIPKWLEVDEEKCSHGAVSQLHSDNNTIFTGMIYAARQLLSNLWTSHFGWHAVFSDWSIRCYRWKNSICDILTICRAFLELIQLNRSRTEDNIQGNYFVSRRNRAATDDSNRYITISGLSLRPWLLRIAQ